MLDANLTEQLKGHLTKVTRPIELVASLDDSPKSLELWDLLTEIAALSDNVAAVRDKDAGAQRRPSFSINRVGTDVSVGFMRSSPSWQYVTVRRSNPSSRPSVRSLARGFSMIQYSGRSAAMIRTVASTRRRPSTAVGRFG